MQTYIALLRAVNVGGSGMLPMSDLKRLCTEAGFQRVQTYIASGNVVFDSEDTASAAKTALEAALLAYAGKPVRVIIRTPAEIAAVLAANPFADAAPNRIVAIFLDHPPDPAALADVRGRDGEELALGVREIYVAFGDAMGRSKLKIPAGEHGTARNMNTVAKLVAMAEARLLDRPTIIKI